MCMQDKTLAKKIDEYLKLKDQIDVLEAQMSEIKEELVNYLQEKETDTYEFVFEGSKHKFSNKIETRMTFDSKGFCENEEYKALYESFKIPSPRTVFRCK